MWSLSMPRTNDMSSLNDVGLDDCDRGKAGVASAQVVNGEAVAEAAERRDAVVEFSDAIERGPLGELEDHPVGVGGVSDPPGKLAPDRDRELDIILETTTCSGFLESQHFM